MPGGYAVRDAIGQALAYMYSRDNPTEALQVKMLTKDEARRIAGNIARLPELLGRAVETDPSAIQGWLGHRSITSTAVYTALTPSRQFASRSPGWCRTPDRRHQAKAYRRPARPGSWATTACRAGGQASIWPTSSSRLSDPVRVLPTGRVDDAPACRKRQNSERAEAA
jgi:hypothetical protein